MARSKPTEERLSAPDGARPLFLLDVAGDYEESILVDWLEAQGLSAAPRVRIRSARRSRRSGDRRIDAVSADHPDLFLIPLRVVWLSPERSGKRSVRWSDLFRLGDPRDPGGIRARWTRFAHRGRVAKVAGTGAPVEELRQAYRDSENVESFESFVTRRAWRALDVEERKLRGNRYKTPRFVAEAISTRREFQEDVAAAGQMQGMTPEKAANKALDYLDEIAAETSPLAIDLIANAIHKLYRQGYGQIRYDPAQISEIARLGHENPIVFLPSHRSNLDRLSLQYTLWENDLPPNHTAGGINLDFFPIGPLLRRTGVFFIRRSFRDNHLYKVVLQHYLDYLIEKRFSLEWYLEGGRSRSGRLLPPRLGLLNYVIDAQRRGKADDIVLVPLSIAYDQIQDVPDYAREAQGKDKESESIGWLVKAVRSMKQRYGDIHIRFGEPVSTKSWSGASDADEPTIDVQKLAFEVMYRIGQATPVTPTSIASIALLASRGKARTVEDLATHCSELQEFVAAREIPTTEALSLDDPDRLSIVLERLVEHGDVSTHDALGRTVYWADDDQMIRISYYRNMIVHFFILRAIAEISLSRLVGDSRASVDVFHKQALELRDLLKFEFFFAEKEEFLRRMEADLETDVPGWKNLLLTSGPDELLSKLGSKVAPWALLPFLDAYQIVADELESLEKPYDEKSFLRGSLDRALMYRIEGQDISGESLSQILFKSALSLARNQDLLDDDAGAGERRADFAEYVREIRSIVADLGDDA